MGRKESAKEKREMTGETSMQLRRSRDDRGEKHPERGSGLDAEQGVTRWF